MWNVREELDWGIVVKMAEQIKIDVVLKRLGYLLSILDIEKNISEEIKNKINKTSYHYLDYTTIASKVETSKDYKLIINRSKTRLLDWVDN